MPTFERSVFVQFFQQNEDLKQFLKRIEEKIDKLELKLDKFEARIDKFEVNLGNVLKSSTETFHCCKL